MTAMRVGLLHPGAMGSALAAALAGPVLWVGAGRSPATRARAEAAGMIEVPDLPELVARVDVIISVCPPAAADAVARDVAAAGFEGIFVDANAISPATASGVAARFARAVDGGIVGPPPLRPGTSRLYLSGDEAAAVQGLFDDSPLEVRIIPGGPGAASALKMAYAAWTKGSAALLLAIRSLANQAGVEEPLLAEWALSQPDLAESSERIGAGIGAKAWRFEGEMREIAATFSGAGLPDGFHLAAADIYDRLSSMRDAEEPLSLESVLALLEQERPGNQGAAKA